jgi:hypothetical protein
MSDKCKHDNVTFTGKAAAMDSFNASLAWEVTLTCKLCGEVLHPIAAKTNNGKLQFITHNTENLSREEQVQLILESLDRLKERAESEQEFELAPEVEPEAMVSDDWLETPDTPHHCPGCKRPLHRIPKQRPGRFAVTCCATCNAIAIWTDSGPRLATDDELALIQPSSQHMNSIDSSQPKH